MAGRRKSPDVTKRTNANKACAAKGAALPNNIIQEEKNMDKYECSICGYIYDEAEGDADNGVAAGTKFADLPADWVCPTCGADKDAFVKMD